MKVCLRFVVMQLVTESLLGATPEGAVQTTTSNSSENIVVNVSIPVSFADGHEIRITLIPRANHPVEVHTERIRVCADAALDNEVPVAPAVTPVNNLRHHISRMNLDNNNHTPTKRNNTVAFDASPARNSSPATRPHTPVVRGSGSQAARWANAVDVSDESGDEEHELIALYPPPYGQQEIIHRDQNDGRKYYVITKGRKIGVFYSSWYVYTRHRLVRYSTSFIIGMQLRLFA